MAGLGVGGCGNDQQSAHTYRRRRERESSLTNDAWLWLSYKTNSAGAKGSRGEFDDREKTKYIAALVMEQTCPKLNPAQRAVFTFSDLFERSQPVCSLQAL
jgi:hypothetical protein